MDLQSILRLVILAAIWGGSFLFMKIASPVLGAPLVAELRVGLAALFLSIIALIFKRSFQLKENWRHYLFVGSLNSALPFLLFCYAALNLPASILSIVNATAPIWGIVFVSIWERQWMSAKCGLGLFLGIVGVAVLLGFDPVIMQPSIMLPILAVLGAAACYGLATTYARQAKSVEPFNNAHGSMWGATVVLLPIIPFFPAPQALTLEVTYAVLLLGIVCSGVAYLLYFRLVQDIGPPSALTVTFIVPVFGVLWGYVFLDEKVGWHTLIGAVMIIIGTSFVTGFSLKRLINAKVVNG